MKVEDDEVYSDSKSNLNFPEFVIANRLPIALLLVGVILLVSATLYLKFRDEPPSQVEVLSGTTGKSDAEIVVEVSGEVQKPGVYRLASESRIEDLLIASGGITANADRDWISKYLNRAAKLNDGQKVFIPNASAQTDVETAKNSTPAKVDQTIPGSDRASLININTAGLTDLDTLPGIGPVYAQSIIDHRPYSTIEELLTKGGIKQNVYDKVKDKVSVY